MTVHETFKAIRLLGLTVRRLDSEWRVNYPPPHGTEATACYTDDSDDALHVAHDMASTHPEFCNVNKAHSG